MSSQQTIMDYAALARTRWPGYEIEGQGSIAVVHHCCKHITLVGHALEARMLIAGSCGPICRKDEKGHWHGAWSLEASVTPPRRKVRFPGWKED